MHPLLILNVSVFELNFLTKKIEKLDGTNLPSFAITENVSCNYPENEDEKDTHMD